MRTILPACGPLVIWPLRKAPLINRSATDHFRTSEPFIRNPNFYSPAQFRNDLALAGMRIQLGKEPKCLHSSRRRLGALAKPSTNLTHRKPGPNGSAEGPIAVGSGGSLADALPPSQGRCAEALRNGDAVGKLEIGKFYR